MIWLLFGKIGQLFIPSSGHTAIVTSTRCRAKKTLFGNVLLHENLFSACVLFNEGTLLTHEILNYKIKVNQSYLLPALI